VLTLNHFAQSQSLQVVADVNAVPPSGIEGVDVMANGVKVGDSQIVGFGALAVGRLKYVTQHELLKSMLASDVPMHIDYHHAYDYACAHAK
jgi:methylene-tetrahydromethanopterin dehydrogenase